LVTAQIKYDQPLSLEQALRFRGRPHDPVDLVELQYERTENGSLYLQLAKEGDGFGSRASGLPVRNKVKNLIRIGSGDKLTIDFEDIPIISSSYADEVFGKLFVEMGALSFMQKIEFKNVDETIKGLIDRAIEQRTKTGL
jgi:hypothetical protein